MMADLKADSGSLLINAVRAGNLDTVKELIHSHGLRCCEGGHRDYFLLFIAVVLGHTEVVKFLLQEGARFDCEAGGVDKTLMHFAAEQRDEELICALAEKKVPIDAGDSFNQTALHRAANEGYEETVKVLFKNNANVKVLTRSGYTPLGLAILGEHKDVTYVIEKHFESLVEDFAVSTDEEDDVNKDDTDKSDIEADDFYKDDVNTRSVKLDDVRIDDINKLVVHIVTHEEYEEYLTDHNLNHVISSLFGRGFVLNFKYVTESLLLSAMKNKYSSLIEQFLKIGHPYDVKYNVLLLRIAIREETSYIFGGREIIEKFLKCNASDVKDDSSISEEDKWIKVLHLLVAEGAEIDKAPELLHLAIKDTLVEVCKLLITNGVDVNAATTDGKTPLHLCCKKRQKERMKKNDEIITLLLNSGAIISSKDEHGLTAFHQAVVEQLEGAVHLFLNFGVDVNLLAEDGSTPLHLAAKSNRLQVAKILCENKANVNACREDGLTPLHLVESGCMVKMLLEYGADIDARGNENQTALHCAVSLTDKEQAKEVVIVLVDNGVNINEETNGDTAMDIIYSKAKLRDTWDYHLDSRAGKIVEILKRHAIKLEAARLYVHDMNLDLFEDFFKKKLSGFHQECEAELKHLKKKKFSQQFALLNILTMRKNPTYARNESLMQSLKSFRFEQFPIYETLLKNTLGNSQSRLELVSTGRKWLGIFVKASRKMSGMGDSTLPDEMLEEIVSYLSNGELKSFISCGEALKDKLTQ